jgi:precorrin-6A synthase
LPHEDNKDLEIYWGAYVGTPDEVLVSGPVSQVTDLILAARSQARRRKGWIMDSYLLRRPCTGEGEGSA